MENFTKKERKNNKNKMNYIKNKVNIYVKIKNEINFIKIKIKYINK